MIDRRLALLIITTRHGFQITGGVHGRQRPGFDSSAAVSEDEVLWHLREHPTQCQVLGEESLSSIWSVPGLILARSTVSFFAGAQLRQHQLEVLRPLLWLEGG